jgi:2-C-methyl-D-erythritol 4-phosphate cytidylyltransferase / 2-C-methyl-D-erythritol 2,4-cyclodiphosphate synthase
MSLSAIIVAAGKGTRLGADQPKQFLDLGDGRTMVDLSIEAFLAVPDVRQIIVAVPQGWTDRVNARGRVEVVAGGVRRQDSMASAFARVSPDAEVVLVHDAARPFVSGALITATADAAARHGAAIAAIAVRDTVKRTALRGSQRSVVETLPREDIFLAQTPQAFRREVLQRALAAADGGDVTDESMLLERAGLAVHVVEGDQANLKITTAEDLARARDGRHRVATMRIGTGYDLHRLVPGRDLILAGVRVPFDLGLQGHSDADIVCHALTDAILGAAAMGDIGRLFPDNDARWKDADSVGLLRRAVDIVREAGFGIGNVDVTVIAERPKLVPYIDEMRAAIAAALGIDRSAVSIKAKTNETVDAVGRGEAMACHAVALLTQS